MKTIHRFKVALAFVMVISGSLPVTLLALNPYEPDYTPPVDSIVVWFNDACNQHQQVRAFWHVTKNIDWRYERPYQMVALEPMYDLPQVKAAFVNFVKSITYTPPTCSQFYGDVYLESYDETLTNDWEDQPINDLVLSLYINLGYTTNLFRIADSLYYEDPRCSYFTFIWNKLGDAYFQHILTTVQGTSSWTFGIYIAADYLREQSDMIPAMRTTAISIIQVGATSSSAAKRGAVANIVCPLYSEGYTQFQTSIESLLQDQDVDNRNNIRNNIEIQQRNHNMMNFNIE